MLLVQMQAVNRMLCKDHKGRCLEQWSDVLIPALAASWNDHFGVAFRISAFGEKPVEAAKAGLWLRNTIERATALPSPLEIIE